MASDTRNSARNSARAGGATGESSGRVDVRSLSRGGLNFDGQALDPHGRQSVSKQVASTTAQPSQPSSGHVDPQHAAAKPQSAGPSNTQSAQAEANTAHSDAVSTTVAATYAEVATPVVFAEGAQPTSTASGSTTSPAVIVSLAERGTAATGEPAGNAGSAVTSPADAPVEAVTTAGIASVSGGGFEDVAIVTGTATANVVDTVTPVTVNLTASTMDEGAGASYVFTATLSAASHGVTTIHTDQGDIAIADGATSGTLTISSGNDEDAYSDASELTASITSVSGGGFESLVIGTGTATAHVIDTVTPVTVNLTASTVSEGSGASYVFTATLSSASHGVTTIHTDRGDISIADGATSGTLTLAANNGEDVYSDATELTAMITGVDGGGFESLVVSTGTATAHVVDTITPVTVDLTASTVPEGASASYVFTATLSVASQGITTIHTDQGDITIADGATSGTLTLAANNGEDVYSDATELTASITSVSGGGFESPVVGNGTVTAHVVDTVTPVTVDLTASTVSEGASASYVLTATLSSASHGITTIHTDQGDITIADGDTAGALTLAANNGEDVYSDASILTAMITGIDGGGFESLVVSTGTATAHVVDTVTPVTVDLSASTVDEGSGASYVFTATLSAASHGVTTIHTDQGDIAIDDGATSGTLTISSGNGEDVYSDATELTASITSVGGGGFESLVVGTGTATAQVVDTVTPVTVNLTASTVSEGSGASYVFTATLSSASQGVTTIHTDRGDISIADGATSGSLSLASGNDEDVYSDSSSLTAMISGIDGGGFESLVIGTGTATANVIDTVTPVTVDLTASTVAEGSGASYVFTATLSSASQGVTTIHTDRGDISIPDGATSGTLSIAANNGEDVYSDASELTASISGIDGGGFESLAVGTDTATAHVVDTVTPVTVNLTASTVSEGSGASYVFTATLSAASHGITTIHTDQGDITIADGATSGTLSVGSGNGEDVYSDATELTASITSVSGGGFESLTVGTDTATAHVVDTVTPVTVTLDDAVSGPSPGTATITANVDQAVTGSDLVINLSNGAAVTIAVGATSGTSAGFAAVGDATIGIAGHSGGSFEALDISDVALLAVNAAPVNLVPDTLIIAEDTDLAISGLSISDSDAGIATNITTTLSVAHGTLTITSAGGAAVSGSGTASVTLTGSIAQINATLSAAGNVVYRGASDYAGSDTLTVTTDDHGNAGVDPGLSGTATSERDIDAVAITVTGVNDAPVATIPASYAATEQTNLNLKNSGIAISDADAGGGSMTVTLAVAEGSLTVTAGSSGAAVSGSGTDVVTITGTLAQINALLNTDATSTVGYIDNTDTPGASTSLTLTVNDNGNNGSGGNLVSVDTAVINITAVNDAPVFAATGSTLTVVTNAGTNGNIALTEAALAAYFTDPDSLTVGINTAAAGSGLTSVTSAGLGAANLGMIGTITVTDNGTLSGTFTVTATDGAASSSPATTVTFTNNATSVTNLTAAATGDSIIVNDSTTGRTLTGGSGSDYIIGNSGGDTIVGAQNDKVLDGSGNTDTLNIGADFTSTSNAQIVNIENVTLTASGITVDLSNQTEAFTITGSSGADSMTAGSGNDTIAGNQTDTLIDGGIGADRLNVGTSFTSTGDGQIINIESVTLTAAATLNLANQTEGFTITGSSGADTITGGSGADSIAAGSGNDIIGGGENDTLLDGGANTDTLNVDADFTSTSSGQIVNIENVTLTAAGITLNLANQTEAFAITGSSGADAITGGSGTDSISAGSGDDTIFGGQNDTLLDGGIGTDTLSVGANFTGGSNAQIVNIENVTLTAAATLILSNQTEGFTITGSSGADSITGGSGGDTILGVEDDALLNGGGGTDTLSVGADFTSVSNAQIVNIENVVLTSSATLNLANQTEGFTITGAAGADSITGGSGGDTILGTEDDTLLNGGGGTDTLSVGADFTSSSNAQIVNIENVTLTATAALDLSNQAEGFTITGSSGADTITGGSGADTITGGAGADTMTGGGGADIFIVNSGQSSVTLGGSGDSGTITGFDVIGDFATGSDTLNLQGTAAAAANTSATNGSDSTRTINGQTVKSHSISNGIVRFDDNNTFNTALNLTSLANVAAVVDYLDGNDIGTTGSTVAFTATIGGVAHTFVYEQLSNSSPGGNSNNYLLVDLEDVTLTSGGPSLSSLISAGRIAPAGAAGEPIHLALPQPADHVGAVTVTLSGLPSGWSLSEGSGSGDGTWTVVTHNVDALYITSPTDYAGAAAYQVTMNWTRADGSAGIATHIDNVEAYAPDNPIFAIAGDDNLTGSSGSDLMVFAQPIGNDTVYNFDVAHDQVDLAGFAGLVDFVGVAERLTHNGNGDAVLTLGEGMTVTFVGVDAASLSAANFLFDHEPLTVNSGNISISDGALLPLAGIVENTGIIQLNATGNVTELQIIQHGITLEGGGTLQFSDSSANYLSGTSADVLFTNVDNTIIGAGHFGAGQMALVNHGTIVASGVNALEIDTGANTVVNTGTLEANGHGGLSIEGNLFNSGLLWANGGDITVGGDITGSGSAVIDGDGRIEIGGIFSDSITLNINASGTLVLNHASGFSGSIAGFDGNDHLYLADIAAGNATLSFMSNADGTGGVLTVQDGAHSANIALQGSYQSEDFRFSSDVTGGMAIVYVPHHDHVV